MAGVVDILLRIVGDSRDAVRDVNQVGDAAEQSDRKVAGLQNRFRGLADTIRQSVAAAGAIIGVAGGIDDALNQLTQGRQERAASGVARAGSRAELEDAFAAQVREAMLRRAGSPLERLLGRNLSLPGGLFGTGDDPRVRDEVVAQQVAQLVASDPDRAAALAALGGPFSSAISAELARTGKSRAFTEELAGRTAQPPTVVIINSGVGDPNRIGEEAEAAIERARRNNGRQYRTTVSR